MKRILTALAICMMLASLTACETMRGLGKDVESAGEWVQKKAQ